MILLSPPEHLLVTAVTEGCIRRHFTVAELVVARLRYVEGHGAATSQDPLALTIAEGVDLRVTAATPIVRLATCQEYVRREDTGVRWHAWRAVLAFFVGTRLCQRDVSLVREVSHIVHGDGLAFLGVRFQHHWLGRHNITLVRFHLAADRTDIHVVLDALGICGDGLVLLVRVEVVDFLVHFLFTILL